MTHICVSKLTIIGSDNGLSPGQRQAIFWTNAGILLIGPLRTNFNEISIAIHKFSFKKIHFKMSSGKWRPSCLGLNVLRANLLSYPKPSTLHPSMNDGWISTANEERLSAPHGITRPQRVKLFPHHFRELCCRSTCIIAHFLHTICRRLSPHSSKNKYSIKQKCNQCHALTDSQARNVGSSLVYVGYHVGYKLGQCWQNQTLVSDING